MLLFQSNLASIWRTLSKTCCYCTVIQFLYLCNTFLLVQYLNRYIHNEIQVNCSRVKVTLTHNQNNNYESVEYLSFLLHIWNVNGKTKPRIVLWWKRSKVSQPVTSLMHLRSDGIFQNLFIADTTFFVQRCRMMHGRR